MNAGSLPLSTCPRFGPTLPVAPASASVWQEAQFVWLEVKIALPFAVPPPPPPPPLACPPCVLALPEAMAPSHLSKAALSSTVALARITACPRPHSSAQTIGNVPLRFGVTR